MDAGGLDKRCTIIAVGRVADRSGGSTRADTVLASVWCKAEQASFTRRNDPRVEQRASITITIRCRPDLADHSGWPEGRVQLFDGHGMRELTVKTVSDPKLSREWLELNFDEGGPK